MTASVVAERPTPGSPRPYHFPPFERARLDNGLSVLTVDLPGRAGKPADLASVSIGDCVESVVADIEGAGLSDVVICGHSMAGVTISAGMPDVPPQPGRFQSQCRASQHDWRSATA